MIKKLLAVSAASLAACAAIFSGCTSSNSNNFSRYRRTYTSFGTYATLVLEGEFFTDEQKQVAIDIGAEVEDMLKSFENIFSTTVEDSDVCRFNEAAPGATVEISGQAYTVLSLALDMYEETEGYYNAGVYYSVDLYGFTARPDGVSMPYDGYTYENLDYSLATGDAQSNFACVYAALFATANYKFVINNYDDLDALKDGYIYTQYIDLDKTSIYIKNDEKKDEIIYNVVVCGATENEFVVSIKVTNSGKISEFEIITNGSSVSPGHNNNDGINKEILSGELFKDKSKTDILTLLNVKTLPEERYISAFAQLSQSFSKIELFSEGGRYYAVKPEDTVEVDGRTYSLAIDLSGIAKGYAVDIIDDYIRSEGYDRSSFSYGSSSMAANKTYASDNGDWLIEIRDPRTSIEDDNTDDDYFMSLYASDINLSTSGDYENYYIIEDTRYCHIIDPFTGSPIQTGMVMANCIGGTAAEADARTTAIMAMGLDRAIEYINSDVVKASGLKITFIYQNSLGEYLLITNIPEGEYNIMRGNYTVACTIDANGNVVFTGTR